MNIDLQTFEALKRIMFMANGMTHLTKEHQEDIKKINAWIDEIEKEHEMDDYKMGGKKEIPL